MGDVNDRLRHYSRVMIRNVRHQCDDYFVGANDRVSLQTHGGLDQATLGDRLRSHIALVELQHLIQRVIGDIVCMGRIGGALFHEYDVVQPVGARRGGWRIDACAKVEITILARSRDCNCRVAQMSLSRDAKAPAHCAEDKNQCDYLERGG